jgi:GT2 family glycosyltransferase
MKILTIVIVSYNVCRYVDKCLTTVEQALSGINGEVYVVDNNSDDDTMSVLPLKYPWVHFISNEENVGFAKANNQAICQSESKYVLLLNPDTIIEKDTLIQALALMDARPKAGGAGVMMKNEDGTLALESRRAIPTPWVSALKMLGFTNRYYMSHLPWDKPCRIEVVSGAFCLLRREALDKVGLLDEDFFMYGEDIDLSYRLLKGGFENWYFPLPIVHYKGKSTRKSEYRYVHVFYQAMLIFFRKHYSHLSLIYTLPIMAAIYFRAFLALIDILRQKLHL